jgi:hypothetical protein
VKNAIRVSKYTTSRHTHVLPFKETLHTADFLIFVVLKNICTYKKGLGNAQPALCSTVLQTSYSIIAVAPLFLNISLTLTLRVYYNINIFYIYFFFI